MTLAFLLSAIENKNQITLVEKLPYIGGCHSVNTEFTAFSEHGPRIYSDRFVYFKNLLTQLGTSWNELFTESKFQISKIGTFNKYTFGEIISFINAWFLMPIRNQKSTSMMEFCCRYGFTEPSKNYIDRLCRLTDGTDYSKYSVYKFLALVNQQSLYKLYQPKYPNNIGLFSIFTKALLKRNVLIKTGTTVDRIQSQHIIICNNQTIDADHIIFAIPPQQMIPILEKSNLSGIFPINQKYIADNSYNKYPNVCFTWNTNVLHGVKRVWGFPH